MAPAPLRFVVSQEEAGEKLDRLVARHADVSRRIARTWIAGGKVSVRGRPVRILTKPMSAGAHIEVVLDAPEASAAPKAEPCTLEILFQDRDLVAIAKPAGLLSEHDRFGAPAVESVLAAQLGTGGRPARLWLVHRLDAGTSGVLLLARTALAARELGAAFRDGKVKKTYLALASGRLRRNVELDAAIARAQGTRHVVSPKGKSARTDFVPLAHGGGATLVGCLPHTGRTHQIRVHLAHLGHPILGDRLYGGLGYIGDEVPEPIARPMLHAYRLRVPHPRTGSELLIEAAPPADFEALGRKLGLWREEPWM